MWKGNEMKETNMEHFRSEIEKNDYSIALVNGEIKRCSKMTTCDECDFEMVGCSPRKIKWLMSEYKPEPVLTEREKHFVEFVETGWVSRDKCGKINWYMSKPTKDSEAWDTYDEYLDLYIFGELFPFITWEDEEPWSVADLRKLKSLEYNPEDVAFKGGVSNETD